MSKNSALAKLTATYTDSENEDRNDSSPNSDNSNESVAVIRNVTPVNTPPPQPKHKKKKRRKVRTLVSYHDDTIVSENEESSTSEESSFSEEDVGSIVEENNGSTADNSEQIDLEAKNSEKYSHYNFKLPPKPLEKPATILIEKITNLYQKMETKNMDMNKLIQERKEFRNPSIYEKLIEFCEIDEFGTNYPSDVYDPKKWRKTEMTSYLKLAEAQKDEMLKKQKDKKAGVEALKLPGAVEEVSKKTKWDQKPEIKKPVTRLVTGNKGKKIPAMGPLK